MMKKASKQLGFAGALVTLATASVIGYPIGAQANPGGDGARMYGDPAAAAPFWRRQHGLDCAQVAVADVVGELTGNQPSEDEVRALSENTPSSVRPGPIWQNGGATDNRDLPILLGHYGIPTVMGLFTVGALAPELGAGRKVIAGVNGPILWKEGGDRTHEDHFVVVTGIDTGAGVVHLNDSGIDSGRDEVIPIAVFEASWATSNHFAVVAK